VEFRCAQQQSQLAFDAQQLGLAPERLGELGSPQHSFFTRPSVGGSRLLAPLFSLVGRWLVPPPGLPQALEHMTIIFGSHPRDTLVDV
jgi:hypothetical protein